MKKSLFVAGLDYSITSDALNKIFSEHGTVESAKVMADKYTNQSRGFGFVEMSTQDEAQECIKQLNETTVSGRKLVVKFKEDNPSPAKSKSGQRW